MDNHAWEAGNETGNSVVEALDSVNELETTLDQSKESMYKLSYVVRVAADSLDELKRRCDEVKDFYGRPKRKTGASFRGYARSAWRVYSCQQALYERLYPVCNKRLLGWFRLWGNTAAWGK